MFSSVFASPFAHLLDCIYDVVDSVNKLNYNYLFRHKLCSLDEIINGISILFI